MRETPESGVKPSKISTTHVLGKGSSMEHVSRLENGDMGFVLQKLKAAHHRNP
jgi:hypothetical protein